MAERPHGIEGVGGMARPGFHAPEGGGKVRVRVAEADANASSRRFRDDFLGSGQFRRDGHHSNLPACRLPKTLESFQSRLL